MKSNENFSINYKIDGFDKSGIKIPDFPILYLLLEKPNGEKIFGPAIIDTGFDASLFANDTLVYFLSDVLKDEEQIIGGFGMEEFNCEIFKIKANLVNINKKVIISLGEISVLVPTDLKYLSDYVIIGRKILNTINFCLDGKKTSLNI